MAELTILRVKNGQVEAHLRTQDANPSLEMVVDGAVVGTAKLYSQEDGFEVVAPIPASVISDGVVLIGLRFADAPEMLGHVTIIAGQPLEKDLHSELALLRAELDMLKVSFRKHNR